MSAAWIADMSAVNAARNLASLTLKRCVMSCCSVLTFSSVEAGVSCMSCHITGILPKTDQIRAHVEKNPKSFTRNERELIRGLYVDEKKMKGLMDEDAERYRKSLEKTGNKVSRPVRKSFCREGWLGGVVLGMALL